eukprot:Skav223238  [mRNA]  locus=scaffold2231:346930:360896:- [translate_table: standard]
MIYLQLCVLALGIEKATGQIESPHEVADFQNCSCVSGTLTTAGQQEALNWLVSCTSDGRTDFTWHRSDDCSAGSLIAMHFISAGHDWSAGACVTYSEGMTMQNRPEAYGESDDEFDYEELPEDPELLEQDDEEEQLDDINRLLAETKTATDAQEPLQLEVTEETGLAKVQQRPQVIDDFFRNFLLKDWVSGISFHPRGSLAPVWACSFHDLGDFVVSCSMARASILRRCFLIHIVPCSRTTTAMNEDQTVKAFDMTSMRCRQTFRGHVDSVNFVTFQPFSNNVLTASGDKTISLWDLRTGLCVQTFYGHANACNHAMFNLKGDTVASCDADGIVKLWDVRVVSEFLQIDTGRHPANAANFDRSGKVLAIAFLSWINL